MGTRPAFSPVRGMDESASACDLVAMPIANQITPDEVVAAVEAAISALIKASVLVERILAHCREID